MRDAGKIVAMAHQEIADAVAVGVSTQMLDQIAEDFIVSQGATPSFKGYGGFPASICTSVNEVVVHGIPSSLKILEDGDIISVDIGAVINGYHGDAAMTHPVGDISEQAQTLLKLI